MSILKVAIKLKTKGFCHFVLVKTLYLKLFCEKTLQHKSSTCASSMYDAGSYPSSLVVQKSSVCGTAEGLRFIIYEACVSVEVSGFL